MQKNGVMTDYRDDVRKKILTCAMNNFRQKGVKSVKMDDIATQLSISKRTLYEIYKNKEDLLFECIKDYNITMDDKLSHLVSPDYNVIEVLIVFLRLNIEEISRVNPLFYMEIHKYPKVLSFLNEKQQIRRKRSVEFMLRGVKEGLFREDVNYEVTNLMADIFMKHVMNTQMYNTIPLPEIIHNVIMILLRGICTESGLCELARITASPLVSHHAPCATS